MRDRLIELHEEAGKEWDCYLDACLENGEELITYDEFHADYLLENGVIAPPCKVGDIVYQTDGTRVYLSTIDEIIYSKNNTIYVTEGIAFDERAIGKSIFLTIKEAEKALKEGVKE